MKPYEVGDIVVGTDGSGPATEAVETAVAIASTLGARVHPCAVVDPFVTGQRVTDPGRNREAASERVEADADRAREAGVEAVPAVRDGRPYAELLAHADEVGADLVVLGTHGRGGTKRVLLGSVAESLVRTTDVPVLTVHGDDERRAWGPGSTVVVGTDGSDEAESAERVGVALAAALGANLSVVSVVDEAGALASVGAGMVSDGMVESVRDALSDRAETAIRRVVDRATDAGVDADGAIIDGEPSRRLREHAARVDADLVVVGTHGRRGVRRIVLGSVAERLLRSADRPVLIVPTRGLATDADSEE